MAPTTTTTIRARPRTMPIYMAHGCLDNSNSNPWTHGLMDSQNAGKIHLGAM